MLSLKMKKTKIMTFRSALLLITTMFTIAIIPGMLGMDVSQAEESKELESLKRVGACSITTYSAFLACKAEIRDDYWIAVGKCSNLADPEEKTGCLDCARWLGFILH